MEDKQLDGQQEATVVTVQPMSLLPLLPNQRRQPWNIPPLPIKRFTPTEMSTRREKGLCFNCDEPFTCSHVSKGKLFALLIDNENS